MLPGDVAFRFLAHADLSAGSGTSASPSGGGGPADVDLEAEAARLGVAPIELDEPMDQTASSEPSVVVCDINASMLEEGRRRAQQAGIEHRLQWVEGDAERLPFEDEEFDAYTIAFGIRNVTHIDKVSGGELLGSGSLVTRKSGNDSYGYSGPSVG